MKELIDKAEVVAEIKRLSAYLDSLHEQRIIEKILSFLDTLEVKEVDLEKEVDLLIKSSTWAMANREDFLRVAKYFFELGIKAQKGE